MAVSRSNAALDPVALRADFPILQREVHGKRLVYLDNAATAQKPRSVIQAITDYYEHSNANVHRGVHTLSHEATELYEGARKRVARFVNANHWRELVYTRNATEAVNLVAHGWGAHHLERGDEVVLTVMEHHADLVPWYLLRDRLGIQLKFVGTDDTGQLRLDELDDALSARTRLVGVVHASNVTGAINPVREIARRAHDAGALCLVDAAQSLPHFAVDVQALGVDFLVGTGHKMLGPTGVGFLWARKELLDEMDPFLGGGDMIRIVTLSGAEWNELPWKFEAGTPHIAGGIGLGAAVDYLEALGMERVFAHEREILVYALERLSQISGLTLYGPPAAKDRLAVVPFNLDGVHPHDVADILDRHGVAVRSGHHCAQPYMNRLGMDNNARASFYLYNGRDDVDALVEAIGTVKRVFKR